jgi:glycosyltransferase involved in cell wall biosynthesis
MKFKEINWYGWSNPTSGYGIVNLEYSTVLQRLGIDVSYGWERQEDIDPSVFNALTIEQRQLLAKPFIKREIGIIKTTPEMFSHNVSDFRIGYTMVENTRIGKKWTEWCNKMDAIFVPSDYLIEVFKESGVKRPVISVRQGIDSRKFPYQERIRKPNGKFVFGTVGYQDERKNWKDLVQAFCSEFDHNESVELWIKNTNPYWVHTLFSDSRIRIINRMYSFEEVQRLYSFFDCFVFPSHAEGSGLPPREAMATGIPAIVTNWSGLTEISDPSISYPLQPTTIDFPDIRGVEQPGFMARIDVHELMYLMRYVYEHQDEVKEKGKKASEFIHKNYCWEECGRDMIRKLEAL